MKQRTKYQTGDKITVKTRKQFAEIPNTFARKRTAKHLHGKEGEETVFLYDIMGHLCGRSFTVEGVNRKQKYIIHDERGQLFTLADWMIQDTTP